MRNRYNQRLQPSVLREEIRILNEALEKAMSSKRLGSKEDLYQAATDYLNKINFSIEEGGLFFEPEKPNSWDRLHYEHITGNINNFIDNTAVALSLLESLGNSVVEGWNIATSRLGRVKNKVQLTASRLTDLKIFRTGSTDAYVWGDTFDNTTRLDTESPLLEEDLCFINDADGVATLPIDSAVSPMVAVAKISLTGNGLIGNNYQTGAEYHGDTSDLLDRNADTWTEYEKVADSFDAATEPLELTISLTLQSMSVINEIRINPNNFGTAKPVKIIEIETSKDGSEWLSAKDEVPFADFLVDDEENLFRLGPTNSKYSGIGIYTFLPREAGYIRIHLTQVDPYVIETPLGQKLRYAIGIRDIEVRANSYKEKGAILSTPIKLSSPARKIYVKTSQNPASKNPFGEIQHLVSWDEGANWLQIKPYKFIGSPDIPEVLNINGPENGAVSTNGIVPDKLRYKAIFLRKAEGFTSKGSIRQRLDDYTEVQTFPSKGPYTVELDHEPVSAISVVEAGPLLGSKGRWNNPYRTQFFNGKTVALPQYSLRDSQTDTKIETADSELATTAEYYPENVLGPRKGMRTNYFDSVRNLTDSTTITDSIDSQNLEQPVWLRVPKIGLLKQDRDYYIDRATGIIHFVQDFSPTVSGVVEPIDLEVMFPPERVRILDDMAYLEHPAAHVADGGVKLKVVKGPKKSGFIKLAPGQQTHDLGSKNIIPSTVSLHGPTTYDASPVQFKGPQNTDLLATGDWTIDYSNGYIHTYDQADAADVAKFEYIDAEILPLGAYEPVAGKPEMIKLKSESLYALDASVVLGRDAGRLGGFEVFHLGHPSVLRGSLQFTGTDADKLTREIPFDRDMYVRSSVEETLTLDSYAGGVATFTLNNRVWSAHWNHAVLSNTSLYKRFRTPAQGLGIEGDYMFDSSNPRILYLKTASSPISLGTISYPYLDPSRELTLGGYMVDYANGILYTFAPLTANLTVAYKFHYVLAEYDIGRELMKNQDYDFTGAILKIKASAIMDLVDRAAQGSPHSGPYGASSNFGQNKLFISYKYNAFKPEELKKLEPYYSPILRGYSLQIVTKDRMIA